MTYKYEESMSKEDDEFLDKAMDGHPEDYSKFERLYALSMKDFAENVKEGMSRIKEILEGDDK